jgi:hypothetical protein
MSKIQDLDLELIDCEENSVPCVEYFVALLANASNLKSLKISTNLSKDFVIDHLRHGPNVYNAGNIMKELAEASTELSQLQSLTLRGQVCRISDLKTFLTRCRSLRNLNLDDLSLTEGAMNDPKPCLIVLLEFLKALCLESLSLGGSMWNGGYQRLDFRISETSTSDTRTLMNDLTAWLGDPHLVNCPLEALRVQFGKEDLSIADLIAIKKLKVLFTASQGSGIPRDWAAWGRNWLIERSTGDDSSCEHADDLE